MIILLRFAQDGDFRSASKTCDIPTLCSDENGKTSTKLRQSDSEQYFAQTAKFLSFCPNEQYPNSTTRQTALILWACHDKTQENSQNKGKKICSIKQPFFRVAAAPESHGPY